MQGGVGETGSGERRFVVSANPSATARSGVLGLAGIGVTVTQAAADVDIFGDGRVVAIHLPGHTPNHLALRVNLASGPVLLSGDLYHSTESRALKGIPPFNTSRAETLAAFDRFERLAKSQNAKVIIQHEPADIAKLPIFPRAAQ